MPPVTHHLTKRLLDPLQAVDLARLPHEIYDNIVTMREAAEDADYESFGPLLATERSSTERGKSVILTETQQLS